MPTCEARLTHEQPGALNPALAVSGYLGLCVQMGEMMLTVGEVASDIVGLNDLAIVLLVLTQREASLMLLVLEVVVTMWASVTFELEGV